MSTDGRQLRRRVFSAAMILGFVVALTAPTAGAAPGGGTGGYKGGGGGGSGGSKSSGGSSGGSTRSTSGSSRTTGGGSYSGGGSSNTTRATTGSYYGGGTSNTTPSTSGSYYDGGTSGGVSNERTSYSDPIRPASTRSTGGGTPMWVWFFWAVVLGFLGLLAMNMLRTRFAGAGASGGTVVRRGVGPGRERRRKREEQVVLAAEEAAMDDDAFTAESVKQSARDLHKAIVEAWTARDRGALAKLVGPDLMVEWNLRLDDFDRKGWHNITERLSEPAVEYLGLVNREGSAEDRVTVRIEAEIRDYTVDSSGERLLRTDDTDEVTTLPEYWTLGRHANGSWYLVSIEQDAEGGHAIRDDIIARPDADTTRLHDEAVAEVAVASAVPDEAAKDIAPFSVDADARTAALDMANIDARFDPDVLEASARSAVAAWAEAVDGADTALEAIATPAAIDELLYASDPTKRTRLVVRGPILKKLRITAIDAQSTPATMTITADLTGRRYRENRDTTTVVEGTKDKEISFTESWTMALDGNDKTPWRLTRLAARAKQGGQPATLA